ncbi:MAG: FAD:protein FMN transferase, partial [Bacteroidota bacterium]
MRANKRTENRFDVSRREFLNQSASLAFGVVLVSPFSPFLLTTSRLCRDRRELAEKSTLPRTSTLVQRATFTMGTIVQVSAFGENRAHCNHAIERMFAEFYRIDRLMSVFKADSQISHINRQAGTSGVRVDQRLVEILELANRLSSLTDGAFDVTIEPLMELWGFRSDNPPQTGLRTRPSDREIAETLQAVGHRNVIIDRSSSTVGLAHPRSRMDLGGIAVGYSLDRAAEILRAEG